MTSLEYLTSKKITPVIRIVAGSNKAEAFVTMTIEQFEEYGKYCVEKPLPTNEDVETWNAAIDAAAENAEVEEKLGNPYDINSAYWEVDKKSIYKLKK